MWNACDGSRFNFQFWQCYQRSLQPYKKGPVIDRGGLGRKDLFSKDGAIMLVCAKWLVVEEITTIFSTKQISLLPQENAS